MLAGQEEINRSAGEPRRFVFRARHRIGHKRDFDAAYQQGVRRVHGPLAVYGRPNGLPESRLGLSVGKRLGNAVRRGRMKRLLREAFRLIRAEMPPGYDLVISVRPHRFLRQEQYEESLRHCWKSIDRECRRRAGEANG
ncbi:MAG: ribonuclease P protein component [Phycisphaerales bacterium]